MSLFSKIIDLANVSIDNMLIKARKSMAYRDQKAYDSDPYVQFQDQGYRERYSPLDFDMLFRMAKDSIVASIIQTRKSQAANFCRPQKDKYDTGYVVRLRDANAEMSDKDKEEVEQICEYLKFTGVQDESRPIEECETFDGWVSRLVSDRYTYDQVANEWVPTNDKRLHHWVGVDASTIRLASTRLKDVKANMKISLGVAQSPLQNMSDEEIEDIKYVQVFKGVILTAFTKDELSLKFGNPTNNIRANGYSEGELEKLINIITAHLHAENHNKLFFTHGQAQKGILHIKGAIRPVQLDAFRRHFQHQTVGNNNAWRTPIIAGTDEVKWIDLSTSNRDMEFTQWMNYLIKIICAIFLIDPEEINFGDANYKAGGGSGPTFMSANESRIKNSQDRGLRPLLRFIEGIINDNIFKMQGWSDKYVFEFVGLNAETLTEEVDRHNKEVQFYMTIDEVRQDHGLSPLGDEKGGHLIQNATYLAWLQNFGSAEQKIKEENMKRMGQGNNPGQQLMNLFGDKNEDGDGQEGPSPKAPSKPDTSPDDSPAPEESIDDESPAEVDEESDKKEKEANEKEEKGTSDLTESADLKKSSHKIIIEL